jgi:cell division protein FtsZ
MGSAAAEGENRAVRAAEQALNSPLLNDNVIEGARYILLNITSGDMEVTMDEVGEINDYIQAQAGQTADIIMGIGIDSTLGDKVGVTVIATGFKTSDQIQQEEKRPGVIVHRLEDEKPATPAPAPSPEPLAVNAVPPVAETLAEPVLIVRDAPVAEAPSAHHTIESEETISAHQVIEFDFPLDKAEPISIRTEAENTTPPPVSRNEPEVVKHDLYSNLPSSAAKPEEKNAPQVSPEEEIYLRSKERIMRLKEMSYKMNSPNGISDLEKEPAYKRRNIKIDNTPSSADSNVSRYTLSMDENEKKPEIRPNNPFLHDRVD